jgi:hypothetical protein
LTINDWGLPIAIAIEDCQLRIFDFPFATGQSSIANRQSAIVMARLLR